MTFLALRPTAILGQPYSRESGTSRATKAPIQTVQLEARMRRFRIVLFPVVCFSLLSLASAQSDRVELFGGYSLERISPGCGSNYRCGASTSSSGPAASMNGWNTSLTGFVHKSFGISAQLSGNYGTAAESYSRVNRYSYQFGPAYAVRWQRTSVFAHALFGGITQSSADQGLSYTRFILSAGGGLDYKISSRISLRPVQLDYERQTVPVVDTGGPTPLPSAGANGFRYSAGIVIKF